MISQKEIKTIEDALKSGEKLIAKMYDKLTPKEKVEIKDKLDKIKKAVEDKDFDAINKIKESNE